MCLWNKLTNGSVLEMIKQEPSETLVGCLTTEPLFSTTRKQSNAIFLISFRSVVRLFDSLFILVVGKMCKPIPKLHVHVI